MSVITSDEPDALFIARGAQGCFLCGSKANEPHWSMCAFGSGDADTDPDADEDLRALEIL